jgi:hypothetical protein
MRTWQWRLLRLRDVPKSNVTWLNVANSTHICFIKHSSLKLVDLKLAKVCGGVQCARMSNVASSYGLSYIAGATVYVPCLIGTIGVLSISDK